jgi:hypothetical protein
LGGGGVRVFAGGVAGVCVSALHAAAHSSNAERQVPDNRYIMVSLPKFRRCLAFIELDEKWMRGAAESIATEETQTRRDGQRTGRNPLSVYAAARPTVIEKRPYNADQNFCLAVLQESCQSVGMSLQRYFRRKRAMISLRVMLRITRMDVCCGPPSILAL